MERREVSVAFTGHRTYGQQEDAALREAVVKLYHEGFTHFLSGMAAGFDLAAAEAVLMLRERVPITLCCVLPHAGQRRGLNGVDLMRYDKILSLANEVVTISESYFQGCFHQRNDYLVDHASVMVAFYHTPKGGTHYTVRRARRAGLRLINIAPKELITQRENEPKLL